MRIRIRAKARRWDEYTWRDVAIALWIAFGVLCVVAFVLALVGCGGPASGTVYDKKYSAPYTYATNNCISYSKAGICLVSIPTFHQEPEHFYICLDDGEEHGCNETDSSTWHKVEIGDWYGRLP